MAAYFLVILIAVAVLFYLFQITFISTAGYTESALQEEKVALEKEQQQLNLESLNAQSLENVRQSIDGLNMVAVDDLKYIRGTSEVAVR